MKMQNALSGAKEINIRCKGGGKLTLPGSDSEAKFIRVRLFNPGLCAKTSYKTISVGKGVLITICCPKGKFNKGKCRVGTRAQRVLYPKAMTTRLTKACKQGTIKDVIRGE